MRGGFILEKKVLTLNGANGILELYPDKVIIKRKTVLSTTQQVLFNGEITIYLSKIAKVQVKKGTALTSGYIRFILDGSGKDTRLLFDATTDENTVMFRNQHNSSADLIKTKIEEYMSKLK
jgi:hypothetical protein